MLLAAGNRHAGVSLQEHDVFVNVVGGIEIGETSSDLPVLIALTSSLKGQPLPAQLVAFGEVGLTGEVRPVAYGDERLREAQAHGFRVAIVPQANAPRSEPGGLPETGSPHTDRADGVVSELQHLELVVSHPHHGALVGDGLEVLEQQPVHGLWPARRQLPAECPVERPDGGARVDDEHARLLRVYVLVDHGSRIGGELADDLLEDVLEGDQALDVAVLVDHEGEAPAVALEESELHRQCGTLGNEVRLAALRDLDQPLAREGAAHQLIRYALHVQEPDEVVELALVHRQSRVWRLAQLMEDVLPALAHIDPGNLLARDHDVVHG